MAFNFLARDEVGGLAGQECNRFADVFGDAHPLHGDRFGVGVFGFLWILLVALGGDPARGYQVYGDLMRRELHGPGTGEAQLGAFGGCVVGEFRHAFFEDFRADHDDSAFAPGLHAGEHSLRKQHRAFDEEFKLVEAGLPGEFFDRQKGLRAGGVGDQDVDRAK